MRKTSIIIGLLFIVIMSSCAKKENPTSVLVKNTLQFERAFETVELTKEFLGLSDLSNIGILDTENEKLQITQTVDQDNDGVMDVILFQPSIAANSVKAFEVKSITPSENPEAPELCYSRFVPERTDDYTWENNKVAFRVFGPDAQYRAENNLKKATLSSGVDAWLKKVEYPIINTWYKKDLSGNGSYHEDTGEGLDNFHVGVSRGVGGIAAKQDSTYYFSKNYTTWRTITTGPIRTSFYLEYESWDAGGKQIKESKVISLDLGSNLSKFSLQLEGTDTVSAGVTLHEKDGQVTGNQEKGWVSYWQPHADSEIGTAIIATKGTFSGFEKYDTEEKDLSNAYAHLNVKSNEVVYYAGFAWKESGQYKNSKEWETYLNTFSDQINTPLVVTISKSN